MNNKIISYTMNGKIMKATGLLSFLVKGKAFGGNLKVEGAEANFASPAGKVFYVSGSLSASNIAGLSGKSAKFTQREVTIDSTFRINLSIDTPDAKGTLIAQVASDWTSIEILTLNVTVKSSSYSYLVKTVMATAKALKTGEVIVPVVDPTPGPTPTPGPVPAGKLLTAFLLPGKPGSKYTNSAGRDSTLCFCNDNDRTAMNDERDYLISYLKGIRANTIPIIICNDDGTSKDSYINPWGNGKWGGPIPSAKLEYLAWMHYKDNDKLMYGYKCESAGLSQLPILFCSENNGGPFSNPSWAEQFIKDLVPFFLEHGNVKWVCTHLEAEKFVTPAEVNRIAGLVKKYMPNIGTIVHATNTDFARCNVDAISVQMPWHPKDGNLHNNQEVVEILQTYLDSGARAVICGEYNWFSEGPQARAQGQAALAMPKCIGAWNGW